MLPDVLTIPLLLLGLAYSLWGNGIPIDASLSGAIYGYLLPSVSVLIVSPFLKDSFGGGDVKMLAALGAWFGMIPLSILLLISVISFICWAFWTKQRAGAYGPHLALAAVITLFLTQMRIFAGKVLPAVFFLFVPNILSMPEALFSERGLTNRFRSYTDLSEQKKNYRLFGDPNMFKVKSGTATRNAKLSLIPGCRCCLQVLLAKLAG